MKLLCCQTESRTELFFALFCFVLLFIFSSRKRTDPAILDYGVMEREGRWG